VQQFRNSKSIVLNGSGGPTKFKKHEPLPALTTTADGRYAMIAKYDPTDGYFGKIERKRPKLDMEPMPMIAISPAYWCNLCNISLQGELSCSHQQLVFLSDPHSAPVRWLNFKHVLKFYISGYLTAAAISFGISKADLTVCRHPVVILAI
jgi:hypothetical protein